MTNNNIYTVYGELVKVISVDAKFVTYTVQNADGTFPTDKEAYNKLDKTVFKKAATKADSVPAPSPVKIPADIPEVDAEPKTRRTKTKKSSSELKYESPSPAETAENAAKLKEILDAEKKAQEEATRSPVTVDFTNVDPAPYKVVRGVKRELDNTVPEVKGKKVMVEVRAFSNMKIGTYEAVYDSKQGIYVVEMKGAGLAKALIFDKKTMRQTNAAKPRFANKLVLVG